VDQLKCIRSQISVTVCSAQSKQPYGSKFLKGIRSQISVTVCRAQSKQHYGSKFLKCIQSQISVTVCRAQSKQPYGSKFLKCIQSQISVTVCSAQSKQPYGSKFQCLTKYLSAPCMQETRLDYNITMKVPTFRNQTMRVLFIIYTALHVSIYMQAIFRCYLTILQWSSY
jgi:hypothetical protein